MTKKGQGQRCSPSTEEVEERRGRSGDDVVSDCGNERRGGVVREKFMLSTSESLCGQSSETLV